MRNFFICAAAFLCAVSCTPEKKMETMIDFTNMDTTQCPGTDFYAYATGGWSKKNPLTDEYGRYSQFDALREKSKEQLQELVMELAAQENAPGSNGQKVGDLYNLAMDSTRRNKLGNRPIVPQLEEIATLKERDDILPLVAKNYRLGIGGFFATGIGSDIMDSNKNILTIAQGGLSLPEKSYYIDNDEATAEIRNKFKEFVVDMFKLQGFTEEQATANMQAVMEIETRIANKSLSRVERRNPMNNYHPMSYDELKKQFPGINWDTFFAPLGITGIKEINVGQIAPIAEVSDIIKETPMNDIIAYLQWRVINSSVQKLSDEIEKLAFDFYGHTMSGKKAQQARWKRAISATDGALSEIIGQLYVAKYFPPEAKARMMELVKNLQIALGERIDAQSWMSDSTKAAAHEKLDAFTVKIGYPDKWDNYDKLTIDPSKSYYEVCCDIAAFSWDDHIERNFNKPVDRSEWHISPQTVNAYYSPVTNEICFPAAILQYPFFDMRGDDAFNYGAIGVVIGHEMTHGFDDQGRQFDKNGNFANWWSEEDAKSFNEQTKIIIDFFNKIEVLPGLYANGQLTVGENIADHGGLKIAMQAFKNATKDNPLPVEDGFTPEQRFYLSYSNVWAGNIRDEEIRNLTKNDPHSLTRWRVNGTLPHIDDWYKAFGITEKDPLFVPKENRLDIW